MIYLVNNEVENLKSIEMLVTFLYEIEQQLFGPKVEPAEAGPVDPAPPGLAHRIEGIQSDVRRKLEQAHRVAQRLREQTGVVEPEPAKELYIHPGKTRLGDSY